MIPQKLVDVFKSILYGGYVRVLLESSIFSFIIGFVVFYSGFDLIISSLTFLHFLFLGSILVFLKKDEIQNVLDIYDLNKKQRLLMLSFTLTSLFFIQASLKLIFLFLFEVLYLAHLRSISIRSNRDAVHFYYPEIENDDLWKSASITLDKSNKYMSSKIPFIAWLSYLYAGSKYFFLRYLSKYEENIEISKLYFQLTILKRRYSLSKYFRGKYKLNNLAKKIKLQVDKIDRKINIQTCRKCGDKRTIEDMYYKIINGKIKFECKSCSSTQKNSWNKKETSSSSKNNISKKTIGVEKAKSILDIKGDLTTDKISKAYREKVKETHPDVGGDKEEFKKIKDAKDLLKNQIKDNN